MSVVIASNRHAPYLDETIASVRAQTHGVHEIILVDDGAPSDELQRAADRHGLGYLRQSASGVSVARNRGVGAATADLIIFLDDDDVWHPELIRCLLDALASNPHAVASFSGGWFLDADGKPLGSAWSGKSSTREDMLRGRANTPVIATMLIRRDAFVASGGFHPSFRHGEDNELVLKLLEMGEFVGVDQPLFGYRRHGLNTSSAGLDGRTGSLRLLTLHMWGADARDDRRLAHLLQENFRSYSRRAGRATAREMLAAARSARWREVMQALWWGIRHRRLRFFTDIVDVVVSRRFPVGPDTHPPQREAQ